jgi:hypothetical protein
MLRAESDEAALFARSAPVPNAGAPTLRGRKPNPPASFAARRRCPTNSDTPRPEIVAAKLDAIRAGADLELCRQAARHTRLPELICFLESQFRQSNGAVRLVECFVDAFPDRLGPKAMHALAEQKGPWTVEQKIDVCLEIPHHRLPQIAGKDCWLIELFTDKEQESEDAILLEEVPELERSLLNCNAASCRNLCRQTALEELPARLFRFCSEPQSPLYATWFFQGLLDALIRMLDIHAKKTYGAFATTEIGRQIADALDYAATGAMVRLEIDGRFRENEIVSAYCAARPGKMRLVDCPCENSDLEFFRALAKAVGLDSSFKAVTAETRAKIVAIAQSCRFLFVFLNAQHLFPIRFSANTPPMRLEWIKTRLVEQHVPVALVATKQHFDAAAARFAKVTKCNVKDWISQEALPFTLPANLSRQDVFTIARSCFPESEIDDTLLGLACSKGKQSAFKIADIQKIVGYARHVAAKAGRATITCPDMEAAIAKVIPPRDTEGEKALETPSDAPAPSCRPLISAKHGRMMTLPSTTRRTAEGGVSAPALESNPRQTSLSPAPASASALEMPARETAPSTMATV